MNRIVALKLSGCIKKFFIRVSESADHIGSISRISQHVSNCYMCMSLNEIVGTLLWLEDILSLQKM